jgi:hypothetical protein
MKKDPNETSNNNSTGAAPQSNFERLKAIAAGQNAQETTPAKPAPAKTIRFKSVQVAEVPAKTTPPKITLSDEDKKALAEKKAARERAFNQSAAQNKPAAPVKKQVVTGLSKGAFLARQEAVKNHFEANIVGKTVADMRPQVRDVVRKAIVAELANVVHEEATAQMGAIESVQDDSNNNLRRVVVAQAPNQPAAVAKQTSFCYASQQAFIPNMGQIQSVDGPNSNVPQAARVMAQSMRAAKGSVINVEEITMEFVRRFKLALPAEFVVTEALICETLNNFIMHAREFNYSLDQDHQIDYVTDISLLSAFLAHPSARCVLLDGAELIDGIAVMVYKANHPSTKVDSETNAMNALRNSIIIAVSPEIRAELKANAIKADESGIDGSVRDFVVQVKNAHLIGRADKGDVQARLALEEAFFGNGM